MPPELTFEQELHGLLARAKDERMSFDEQQHHVRELHRKHHREMPEPITGTVSIVEPEDRFG
jgi:hypothetical protein